MRVALVAACLLLAAPLVAAQPAYPTNNNATAPSVNTGNDGSAMGPAESTEKAPGISYGVLVLVGTLAFAAGLAFVAFRYDRNRRRGRL